MKRSSNNEKQLTLELAHYFHEIEQQVQELLKEYGSSTFLLQGQIEVIISPIKASHEEYYTIIKEHILNEFDLGTAEGDRLVQLNNPDVTQSVVNEIRRKNLFGTLEYTEERLLNQTFVASQNTLNRVNDNINHIITDGYKSGEGIDYVGRKINERFNQLKSWEARRIARTEIHGAHQQGIMRSYETLGVNYTQWSAAHDIRTRKSHIDIDGEIIPFGGTYSNKLKHPGDRSGPIEEWINCRCSNAPFVMPDGYMAPPGMSHFEESDLIPIQ